jgi:hypothetical protein
MVFKWTTLHYKTVTKFWSYHLLVLIQPSAEWTNINQSMTNFVHSAGYRFSKALARIGSLGAEPTELVQTSSVYRLASRVPKSPSAASPLNAFKTSIVPLKNAAPNLTVHSTYTSRAVIRLWGAQPRKRRFDFRQKNKWFSSFPMCPRRMLGPTTLLFKGKWGFFSLGRVKGAWSWTISFIYCWGKQISEPIRLLLHTLSWRA